jgi:hypothetical protein
MDGSSYWLEEMGYSSRRQYTGTFGKFAYNMKFSDLEVGYVYYFKRKENILQIN